MTTPEKDCFGILDRVFPMGQEGLREIVDRCFACPDRMGCLKAAMASREGITLKSEVLERSAPAGFMGRLKRWSERKAINRLLKERERQNQ